MRRRDFLVRLVLGGTGLLLVPQGRAQDPGPAGAKEAAGQGGPDQGSASNLFEMNQGAAKSVRRPPKPGATASMTADQRDALEHDIRCQCGCTLDVYTCRTTDFSCAVSPAMHRDIMSLVDGGHSAREILDAFVDSYGERALMAPRREGFNLAGYLVPFAALGAGAAALVAVLRGMQRRSEAIPRPLATASPASPSASGDELARLQAAVRRDD